MTLEEYMALPFTKYTARRVVKPYVPAGAYIDVYTFHNGVTILDHPHDLFPDTWEDLDAKLDEFQFALWLMDAEPYTGE